MWVDWLHRRLTTRVAKLEAEAKRQDALIYGVEQRVDRLENPTAVAWTRDVAAVQAWEPSRFGQTSGSDIPPIKGWKTI